MGFDSQIRKMPSLEKRSEGNLNRLDPTTRVIGGVRERRLKLLPPEEIQLLDVPTTKESLSPIKNVIYMSRNDALHEALPEASVIVREHTPITNLFMCLWFNEVVRFTSRDQLCFPYVLWRLKVLKNINMFPVCTRKDLVNSMGHIRKAKPLMKAG